MPTEFRAVDWEEDLVRDCRVVVRLALREDVAGERDWTSWAIVGADRRGAADVVARESGVVVGVKVAALVLDEARADATWTAAVADGDSVDRGTVVGRLEGSARDLLTCERVLLNFMGRLSGIATLASRYVAAVAGTKARLYDTRKTTPGWRLLEKYAVRCGGAWNHRTGLYDAVLIKDNHLALACEERLGPAAAVELARRAIAAEAPGRVPTMVLEVEVDTLDQLRDVLAARPDVVLLDNMHPSTLAEAVAIRDAQAPGVVLEASGGVRLETVGAIAASGIDRISVGALTHSARGLDLGLDWRSGPPQSPRGRP
ncbi:MAG: carboxylating nicotinate-nucleotide diphosphorylase [Lacipirellulaceae bacterium]